MVAISTIGQLVLSGVMLGLLYGFIALGLNFIFGVTKILLLSYGGAIMVSQYMIYFAHYSYGLSIPLSLVAGIGGGLVVGVGTYALLLPLLEEHDLIQVLATFGVLVSMVWGATFIWTSNFRYLSLGIPTVNIPGFYIAGDKFVAAIAFGLIGLMLYLFLNKTWLGRAISAISQNYKKGRLIGLSRNKLYLYTFLIAFAILSTLALFTASVRTTYPVMAYSLGNIAFVTMLIGGLGSWKGTAIAGIMLGIIRVLVGYFTAGSLGIAAVFFAYFIFILIRPQGLFGTERTR